MTYTEKKEAWLKLSPEKQEEAQRRKDELIRKQSDELDEKYDELVKSGAVIPGIGADPEELNEIKKRQREELIALMHEYGLAE